MVPCHGREVKIDICFWSLATGIGSVIAAQPRPSWLIPLRMTDEKTEGTLLSHPWSCAQGSHNSGPTYGSLFESRVSLTCSPMHPNGYIQHPLSPFWLSLGFLPMQLGTNPTTSMESGFLLYKVGSYVEGVCLTNHLHRKFPPWVFIAAPECNHGLMVTWGTIWSLLFFYAPVLQFAPYSLQPRRCSCSSSKPLDSLCAWNPFKPSMYAKGFPPTSWWR